MNWYAYTGIAILLIPGAMVAFIIITLVGMLIAAVWEGVRQIDPWALVMIASILTGILLAIV